MADFNVRSDSVNVEQIMEQIRARIREKRGVDYTEQQIRELAAVKLEKFLDPRGVRSDLLDQFRRAQTAQLPPDPPNFAFGEDTLFESHRGLLRWLRRLLRPVLKLFFNPNPLIQALHIQSQLNTMNAERESARRNLVHLQYEVLHNLVIELTRTGIEVKNLKMRVESLASRLDFAERRARALESVVVYKPAPEERYEPPAAPARARESRGVPADQGTPDAPAASTAAAGGQGAQIPAEGPGQRSRRRRRRRGRRGSAAAAAVMGATSAPETDSEATGRSADLQAIDEQGGVDDSIEEQATEGRVGEMREAVDEAPDPGVAPEPPSNDPDDSQ